MEYIFTQIRKNTSQHSLHTCDGRCRQYTPYIVDSANDTKHHDKNWTINMLCNVETFETHKKHLHMQNDVIAQTLLIVASCNSYHKFN